MTPIWLLSPILNSVNMVALAQEEKKDVPKEEQKESECHLKVPEICSPVCDAIFSGIDDPKRERETVKKMFGDSCDSVCQCICEPICDGIV